MENEIEGNSPSVSQELKGSSPRPGFNRRSMLRASAGASPILLTLASGPVLAGPGLACTVASSFVSAATFLSRNPGATSIACASQSPDYWRSQAQLVPTPASPPELSGTVAALLGATSSTYNALLVKNVLVAPLPTTGPVQTTGELGTLQHLIAMALNLKTGNAPTGPNFTFAYIQGIWSNYKANGNRYILPASNINWGDTEIIAWMRFLMYPISLP